MKRKVSLLTLVCFFMQSVLLSDLSAYTVEKLTNEEALNKSLSRGWIQTNAEMDSGTGVIARMVGVINAPPEEVWELFIKTNNYKEYKIPTLIDSRALTKEFVSHFQKNKTNKIAIFYSLLGDQYSDPLRERTKGGLWTTHAFQYYDIPWPSDNKWILNQYHHDERRAGELIYRTDQSLLGGNVKRLDGKVILSPFQGDKNRTIMDYSIHVDTGYYVPHFLLRWGATTAMPRVIKAIRRHLKKVKKESLTAEDNDES